MSEIPNIGIRRINVPDIPNLYREPPLSIPPYVPVTQLVGTPIVDMPGCVEYHPDGGPQLAKDDPEGARVQCDATVPSYNPINYEPEQMVITRPAETPKVPAPETPELPAAPKIPKEASTAGLDCPTEAQQLKKPVGSLTDDGKQRIIEYRLVGRECIPVTENISIPTQIIESIPSAGAITTTASIAVVATSSALLAKPLADLLLKVIKPVVKKVMKKIAKLRGKNVKNESVKDRRDQQRIRSHAIRKLKGKE